MEVLLIALLSIAVFSNCVLLGLVAWKLFGREGQRRSERAVEQAMAAEKERQDLIDEGIQEILAYKPKGVKDVSVFEQ